MHIFCIVLYTYLFQFQADSLLLLTNISWESTLWHTTNKGNKMHALMLTDLFILNNFSYCHVMAFIILVIIDIKLLNICNIFTNVYRCWTYFCTTVLTSLLKFYICMHVYLTNKYAIKHNLAGTWNETMMVCTKFHYNEFV